MTDIVERLHKVPCKDGWAIILHQHVLEAADEIERLQAQLGGCRLACDLGTNELEVLRPEIERLRAQFQPNQRELNRKIIRGLILEIKTLRLLLKEAENHKPTGS